MGRLWIQSWTGTLCVLLSWVCFGQIEAGPQYMVAIPAVLEAGATNRFCINLMQPNETLQMRVTLQSHEKNTTLFLDTTDIDYQKCVDFKAPVVADEAVKMLETVVQGKTFYSREVRKVKIKSYKPVTFIQTDKPLYLPGQTVYFRVVSMDIKFRPAKQMYQIIELQDSNRNRIGQWLNQTASGTILQLSHALNSEAREGFYRLVVSTADGQRTEHSFKVEKYVLPKFDITLKGSDKVTIVQDSFSFDVCGKYTYGQPVPGSATVKVCRLLNRYLLHDIPCHEETKQTDKTGCASFTLQMSTFTKLAEKAVQEDIDIRAKLEEEGTEISREKGKRLKISYAIGKLSFIDTPKIFHQGSPVEGKVKGVYYNNTPMANVTLYLFEGVRWSSRHLQNLTTDHDGVASFSISTDDRKQDLHLHVSSTPSLSSPGHRVPFYESGEQTVSMFRSPSMDTKSVSSLEVQKKKDDIPCDQDTDISVHYTIAGEAQGSATLVYLVLARGAIVMQGVKEVMIPSASVVKGEITFPLSVTADMAPVVQVVAYTVLPSETVIADSEDFSTQKCFNNKASLRFSMVSPLPGEQGSLQMKAQPHSLCGVSAVDQSVLIERPGETLDAEKIFKLLPLTKASHIPYDIRDPEACLPVRPKRSILPYPGPDRDDAFTVFQNVGLKMATNLFIRIPLCMSFKGRLYRLDLGILPEVSRMHYVGSSHYGGGRPPIVTVRTFFPETWLWDLVEVGESGSADVPVTVPDTITTWETEAFCLSPEGFGLAPREKLTVFQPFFVELSLPYSIIRGENFDLKATIFNYMDSCIMIGAYPSPSTEYTVTPYSGVEYTSCLCGNERKTLRWAFSANSLGPVNITVTAEAVTSHTSCNNEIVSVPEKGRIDVVTRSLIVKAEGTEMTENFNYLLCPNGGELKEEVTVQLPENVIDGSVRAVVSVLGDILGRAMQNLDGLLRMPYGCGEQNMALLAPNIYILQYLSNTQQLKPDIKEKATNFLTSGYQRQLNYKHRNGAYSTFGTGTGNTWLTAFVVRSFAKAKSFVYIDPQKIKESKNWLKSMQKENGCFQQSGKLFNNRMKGGVSDEVTLSAYITAAFLEINAKEDEEAVKKSLLCLRQSTHDHSNTYTTALMAYVFTLAGDVETRNLLLQHLDKVAVREGGFLHWEQDATDKSSSLSVEISSYVLLARLSSSPSAEDLGYSSNIVRWLTRQQNYYGGFSSTQDTVVALQALALYSTLVFSPAGSSSVTFQSPGGDLLFEVNQDNKLLYQEKMLEHWSGQHNLVVKGTACASAQLAVHYNVPTPVIPSTLRVSVEVLDESNSLRSKLKLSLTSLYNGEQNSTNMVIIDIKLLSGFSPAPETLKNLRQALLVDRVEHEDDHVLIYLEELPKDIPIHHSLHILQDVPVENLKPAVVKIYDYYQTTDEFLTEYTLKKAD
ncbi:alpha-2-macroglobulin-like [Synchiropus splendidus]|uniref:alpha-2-macroglobulin-like n=1 Tax=Synchiropus splendidus TaxID=270530 RepID=UPI00237ED6B8|nr:alpha-2-macroglobulin-like [Synchiropus splendidus]